MVIVGQGLQVFVEYSLEYPDTRQRKPDQQQDDLLNIWYSASKFWE